MNKILTIVIPTYNMEKYLQKCLDSLIIDNIQLLETLEVLVVNDGSKDSSLAIGRSYESKYPKVIRVIDKENGNYGSCVNRGLKEATGKYIKILDADDSFDTEGFSKLLSVLQTQDVDLVITDRTAVDENGDLIDLSSRDLKSNVILPVEEVLPEITENLIEMHAVFYRTENLRAINYHQTEGISYTDQEWMFLPMTTVKTVYYMDTVVYKYLLGREGQTVDINVAVKSLSHKNIILTNYLKYYPTFSKASIYIDYLEKRIYEKSEEFYKMNLIVCPEDNDLKDLITLDDSIKNLVPSVYKRLNTVSIRKTLPIKYIKAWRNGNRNKLPLSVKLSRFVLNVARKTKKMI